MKPLLLYVLRPEGFMAQVFAHLLSTPKQPVHLHPLSALPAVDWQQRQRQKLEAEQKELRQAIVTLEMGIALATAAPHRFPEGAVWAADKQTHERRLKVVAWKLEQLAKEEGGSHD